MANTKRSVFPNPLGILFISHGIYYWNVLWGQETGLVWLVCFALLMASAGYLFEHMRGLRFRGRQGGRSSRLGGAGAGLGGRGLDIAGRLSPHRIDRFEQVGLLYLFLGIMAHLYYYATYLPMTQGYGDSYFLARGKGYITVFFDFCLLGFWLMEYAAVQRTHKASHALIRAMLRYGLMLGYMIFYLLVLAKRRQILMLALGIIGIQYSHCKNQTRARHLIYLGAGLAYIFFSLFGKLRGYYTQHGFSGILSYLHASFSPGWLGFGEYEGKYTAAILRDTYRYIQWNGYAPTSFIGALGVFIPRRLYPEKLLAFPEWYASTFHPQAYQAGQGFAGSMVAELYRYGGMPVLGVGYWFIGIFAKGIGAHAGRSSAAYVTLGLSVYILFCLPRLDVATLWIDFVFLYVPLWGGCSFACQKNQKHRRVAIPSGPPKRFW